MRRLLPALVVAVGLWGGVAAAEESEKPPPTTEGTKMAKAPDSAPLSPEDREVVENLELLESMDTTEDLDLLLELSQEE